MKEEKKSRKSGFTLLEILLVLGILGVIAVFTIGIAHSIRNLTKVNDTKSRMEQISAKAKEYYRGHEELPAPGTTPADSVPVGAGDLNMEQKFRLDGWGQYFFYDRKEITAGTITIDGIAYPAMTYINAFDVEGKIVAGVIISAGPNQAFDRQYTAGSHPWGYGGTNSPETYATAGDDILIPINVSQEAVEIALEDLKVLQAKVKAFDAIYEGVDNDSNGTVDEDGCVEQRLLGNLTGFCPPAGGDNDPNCGTRTLEFLDHGSRYTSCIPIPTSARDFICNTYSLGDKFRVDPWLNPYIWASEPAITPGLPFTVPTSDPRYHKFFSAGPDGSPGAAGTPGDDIIP